MHVMSVPNDTAQAHGTPTDAQPHPGVWATIREALAGSRQDFTAMPIRRAVPLLAIPMVLEMLMESLFAVVSIFWVARLGAEAVATVGLTEAMLSIVYALAMGLGMAGTAVIARRAGAKDQEGASIAAVQVLLLGIAASALIGVSAFYAVPLLRIMGASEGVIETGLGYTVLMLGGNATVTLLFILNAAFRGAGDAAIAMRALWLANGLNIVLVPVFVYGFGPIPEMGVTGAAVATNIGRGIGVAFALWLLFSGTRRLTIAARHWKTDGAAMATMLKIGWSASVQMLIMSASWIGVMRILAMYGDAALAGFTIAMRVMVFAFLPAWGTANAAATLVGQNLGAGKPDRAENSAWVAGHYNAVLLVSWGVAFLLIPEWIIGLFTSDAVVAGYAVQSLRAVSVAFPFFAYGMVLTQSFNGAGDTVTPLWLNIVWFWMFQIPVAWILAQTLGMGPSGVFWAGTLSYMLLAATSVVLFRRGTWKSKRV